MSETTTSVPLKTAEGAYPALPAPDTHCHDEDTSRDVWSYSAEQMRAYAAQAVAAQAAPAAPDTNRLRAEILEHASKGSRLVRTLFNEPTGTLSDVEVGDWIQRAQQYLRFATPAPPATGDSSAGDLAEASHQTKLLAQALGDCILASGIVRSDQDMSGPQLLMFAKDLKELLLARQAEVQAEPVAWMRKTDVTELTDSEPETDGWTPLCAAPQAQPADALDAARYRYLRDGWTYHYQHESREKLDASLDAAMAAAQEGGKA